MMFSIKNAVSLFISILLISVASSSDQDYRLSTTVKPERYFIEIITDLEAFEFEGNVDIAFKCTNSTKTIRLHSKNLEISEKSVRLRTSRLESNASEISIISHSYDTENDFYTVTLNEEITPDHIYYLYIPYLGNLTDGLVGYYRSSYLEQSTNQTKWLAVTQFESCFARNAFPCFDEPSLKAVFEISLGHSKHLSAASNMPLMESKAIKERPDYVLDTFEPTVPMSTYLVAFLVSEFEYRESPKTKSNVTFRVWARKDAIEQVELAEEIGPKVLSYYEEYFGTPYPLPKQDMVAIPDFDSGAMENWGLITYREIELLFDPKSASSKQKQRITSTIAHELAHQWFGNLVTMKWWSDLWLNEGFATHVEAVGMNYIYPEWNSLDITAVESFMSIMDLDELSSSHAVSVKITNPREIGELFDNIVYEKGSYLIRMMNIFLGEGVFRNGVANYLQKYKYQNAEQDDLWQELTDVAHKAGIFPSNITVKMIMDTWSLQIGYPLLTITRDYENNVITVTQERYLSTAAKAKLKTLNETQNCWWVPLSYTTKSESQFNDTKPKQWLKCDEELKFHIDANKNDWTIFNLKITGLYRLNYDTENWNLLMESLLNEKEYKSIDPLNRVQLVADSLALAKTGSLHYQLVFNLLLYLEHETEYLPWSAAISGLSDISNMVKRTSLFGSFRKFMQKILEPSFNKIEHIKNIPKGHEDILKHVLISEQACKYDVGNCKEQADKLFSQWYHEENPDKVNPIPSDIKPLTYCNALQNGGEKYFDFLWSRYENANVATEQRNIIGALSCTKEVWLLQKYLEMSINSSQIRAQDSSSVFGYIANNEIGYLLARDFLMANVDKIYKIHQLKSDEMGYYLKAIAKKIQTEEELKQFESFVSRNSKMFHGAGFSLKQGLESAENNIFWHNLHYKQLSKMLTIV